MEIPMTNDKVVDTVCVALDALPQLPSLPEPDLLPSFGPPSPMSTVPDDTENEHGKRPGPALEKEEVKKARTKARLCRVYFCVNLSEDAMGLQPYFIFSYDPADRARR